MPQEAQGGGSTAFTGKTDMLKAKTSKQPKKEQYFIK